MRLPPLYGAAIFQDTCVALIKKVRVGGVETTYINRFTLLMWGHIKNRGKRKPRKSRLLSSTKWEENRIESYTAVNQKLRKSKPRKSRNAFTNLSVK